jgi:hypothetical protein
LLLLRPKHKEEEAEEMTIGEEDVEMETQDVTVEMEDATVET